MADVKETKELMVGLLKLAALLGEAFKDGVQVEDAAIVFAKLQSDAVLKQAILDAYNGMGGVSAEVKEIDLVEAVQLVQAALPELMNLIKVLKK